MGWQRKDTTGRVHKARYHSFDAHVSCSCGWTEQAQNETDGEDRIDRHLQVRS
jgi:hypothetical protein